MLYQGAVIIFLEYSFYLVTVVSQNKEAKTDQFTGDAMMQSVCGIRRVFSYPLPSIIRGWERPRGSQEGPKYLSKSNKPVCPWSLHLFWPVKQIRHQAQTEPANNLCFCATDKVMLMSIGVQGTFKIMVSTYGSLSMAFTEPCWA